MSQPQSLLILVRATPYGSHQSRAALDVVLTAAVFEWEVSVVFLDAGVMQLLAGQDTAGSDLKNIGDMIPALAAYEVDRVCLHRPSARRYGVDDKALVLEPEVVDDADLRAMAVRANQVMVF